LEVRTVIASRGDIRGFELRCNIFGGKFFAVCADAAAFQAIGGQIFDVFPKPISGNVKALRA
jgi:hypothetical protein